MSRTDRFRRDRAHMAEPVSKPALENVRALSTHSYIVWTQAGFKQAIRMLYKAMGDSADDGFPVEGYPTQYPAVVTFSEGYRGYHYWQASCIHLLVAIEQASDRLTVLESAYSAHRSAINTPHNTPTTS